MTKRTRGLALVISLVLVADLQALDTVRKIGGGTAAGTIQASSPDEVTVEKTSGVEKVPTFEIDRIEYDGEPAAVKLVRSAVRNGSYQGALSQIEKIPADSITRDEIKRDLEYYKSMATAKLAIGGAGDARTAGKAMLDFVAANPNSYHAMEANEIVGDLLVTLGTYDQAQQYYDKLAQSAHAVYKMRGGTAKGRALVAQGKHAEALQAFENVLQVAGQASGSVAEAQKFAATLGKADCLARGQKADEAIQLVNEVIAKLNPEQSDLQAAAYVTLGNCYLQKPDSTRDALLAFLHVDVLFSTNPQAHAEALANLADLWDKIGKTERSVQAEQVLQQRYANSTWAKKSR